MDKTTVGERGQTAIPAGLRKRCGVGPGTRLIWEALDKDDWKVHIVRKSAETAGPLKALGYAGRFRATRRTSDWMKELRAGDRSVVGR